MAVKSTNVFKEFNENLAKALRDARDRFQEQFEKGLEAQRQAVKGALKTVTPTGLRRRALRATQANVVYRSPPPPDELLMAQLRRRYKPQVVALSEYLDRDLVRLWGYDDVD